MSKDKQVKKVVEIEGSDELGKRVRLDAVLTSECPLCEREIKREFRDYYLSYPSINRPIKVVFVCSDEDPAVDHSHLEWSEDVILRAQLAVHSDTEKVCSTYGLSDEELQTLKEKGFDL